MKALMIDTATQSGSVALFDDDRLIGTITFNTQLKHLQTLHIAIKDLLKFSHTEMKEIKLIGVDIGPGSFTGIKIGVTAARAFAQAGDMYIAGVTSLELLAYKIPVEKYIICSIIDGKKGKVYTGFFKRKQSRVVRLKKFYDIAPAQLVKIIKQNFNKKEIIFVGDGQINYRKYLKQNIKKSLFTDENFYYPEARDIFYLINKSTYNKNYNKIIPFYLRKSDAEEKK